LEDGDSGAKASAMKSPRLTVAQRRLLEAMDVEGVDLDCSLRRGIALIKWSMKAKNDRILITLVDRAVAYSLVTRKLIAAHSERDDGMIFGVTPAGRAALGR
jgi:hypothetical protein